MIQKRGPEPFASFMPIGPEAVERYEEWQIRSDFRRALRRSALRAALTGLMDGLCAAYGALGLGALRRGPAKPADDEAAEPGFALIDDVAGTIDRRGVLVDGAPRLRPRDIDAWTAAYGRAREHGVGRIPGRFGMRGFYLSGAPGSVIRLELARALGAGSFATATPPRAVAGPDRRAAPVAAAGCRAGTGLA